jgi:hypothetical protein
MMPFEKIMMYNKINEIQDKNYDEIIEKNQNEQALGRSRGMKFLGCAQRQGGCPRWPEQFEVW